MLRYIYNILLYLAVPFILIRLLWRSIKSSGYRKRWNERFGFFTIPKKFQHGIVIHAASVGETIAAIPLIRQLQKDYPNCPITVTTMTVTGSQQVKKSLKDSVFHVYVPYDLPDAVKRFFNKTKPKMLIIMETELWPNFLHYARARQIPILLANARLSKKSAKGYAKIKNFTTNMLKNINNIAAQAPLDANRFIQLGAPQEHVITTGSIKFDIDLAPSIKEAGEILRQQLGANRPVWITASTHEGEEEIILNAFKKIKHQLPDCLLIIVPRHPERFAQVHTLCKKQNYNTVLRSSNEPCTTKTDIFLGDTMGELMQFYAASDIAFVGGSLAPIGGHNFLEPAILGLPIISGPHVFNFAEIARMLQEKHALVLIENSTELAAQVIKFFNDPKLRQQFGENAKVVVDANRGAVIKHMQLIQKLLS
ncbi:MAG: lipid IV(A) 3-deoxy-D-manno-octulosonic acid transferase [Gammaproteobacteria bacterium]|jgi:3-deoxy-D-manno-octulosonic-acid transferase